jgi:hypothetical protein
MFSIVPQIPVPAGDLESCCRPATGKASSRDGPPAILGVSLADPANGSEIGAGEDPPLAAVFDERCGSGLTPS